MRSWYGTYDREIRFISIPVRIPFENALLIVNPVSGQSRGRSVSRRIQAELLAKGIACTVRMTAGPAEATVWARDAAKDGFDVIIAIGGDGTIQEIVAGQVQSASQVPIAVVPMGTANVVALALSLPWLPGHAVDTILKGRILPFDVGYLPELDRYFFLMAAIGFPAQLIKDSPRRLKNMFGILTYLGAGLRNMFRSNQAQITIESAGQTLQLEANTVLVANIGKIGEINLKVAPDTSCHDGKLDISVISSRTIWDLIKVLFRMLTWRYKSTRRLNHLTTSRAVIHSNPKVPVQIDGEVIGTTPVVVETIPQAVKMIVGKRYQQN